MARGISEAEYEQIRQKASRSVRFSDSRPTAYNRRPRAKSKTRRAKTSTGFKEVLPVLGVAALVALMGAYLAGRARTLGDSQNAQYGSDVASVINQIIPIPGLGEIASFVGGLFGPSTSYTPGGETYCQASDEMHSGYYSMMNLVNQVREQMGLQPAPLLDWVGPGTATPNYSGNVCNHNAALVGPYFAKLLQNPALASQTSCAQKQTMESNGTFDAAIAMQNQLISHLQYTLYSLESGVLVASNGRIVSPDDVSASGPGAGCYDPCLASIAQDANSTAIAAQSGASASFSGMTQNEWIVLGGIGVLGLIVLTKKLRG